MRFRIEHGSGPETVHLVWGPLAVMIVLAGWLLQGVADKFPPCVFHEVVGLPCLTCGATRSVIALSHLNIGQSIALNPLVPVFVAGLMTFSLITLLSRAMKKKIVLKTSAIHEKGIRAMAVLAIIANWLYLIAAGR